MRYIWNLSLFASLRESSACRTPVIMPFSVTCSTFLTSPYLARILLTSDPQGELVYLQLDHNPVTDIEMQQQLFINNVFSFKLTHLGFVRKSHKPSILAVHLPDTNDVRISMALQKMNQIPSGYSLSLSSNSDHDC